MAYTKYPNLPAHLRKWGLKVEEVSDWQTRSANSTTFTPTHIFAHHTAGAATGNAPSLRYIRDNNLSQFVLGRDGTVYVNSGNRQNHGGVGGPLGGIPADAANRYAWGIEAENTGRGEVWTKVQLNAYYRLCAALCNMMGKSASAVIAHKEWAPSRKSDPAGIEMRGFRDNVTLALNAGPSGTPTTVGDPVLGRGDSGSSVTTMQNLLVKNGRLTAAQVDGDFGPTTEGAVISFQRSKGLVDDGIVGQRTWDALRRFTASVVTPTPTTGGNRMIVQFKGDNHVWEVVGSKLYHITAAAWKARGLTSASVKVLEPTHGLNTLEKVKV